MNEKILEEIDKEFLQIFDKEADENIVAFNSFVRASTHTALEQIYKDAIAFAGPGKAAGLLAGRVVSLIYHSHHNIVLGIDQKKDI